MKEFEMEYIPKEEPLTVYKLVRIKKDGNLYALFIGDEPFIIGKEMHCQFIKTKGFGERSITTADDEDGLIGGFHCTLKCLAPHLKMELANGEIRVWIKCLAWGRVKKYPRPESQGGTWILVEYLKVLEQLSTETVAELQKEAIKQIVQEGWAMMNGTGIRGTIVPECYKETIAKVWNVDLNKKPEVTDPYYFCEQDGELWFCWE